MVEEVHDESGNEVGVVRFDELRDGSIELSWTVAPEWRGRGIGKKMVSKALGLPLVVAKQLKARIKKNNLASQKIAQAVGFHLHGEHGGVGEWRLVIGALNKAE